MSNTGGFLTRVRKCPLAHSLALTTVILFGISFFFALDQKTVMLSPLAKPIILVLLGLPTLTAVITIIIGSKCRMRLSGS